MFGIVGLLPANVGRHRFTQRDILIPCHHPLEVGLWNRLPASQCVVLCFNSNDVTGSRGQIYDNQRRSFLCSRAREAIYCGVFPAPRMGNLWTDRYMEDAGLLSLKLQTPVMTSENLSNDEVCSNGECSRTAPFSQCTPSIFLIDLRERRSYPSLATLKGL